MSPVYVTLLPIGIMMPSSSVPPSTKGEATPRERESQQGSKCVTPRVSVALNGQIPPPSSRHLVVGEQGKRVRFYRNGDAYFKGIWYLVSSYRSWDSLLEDLNHHLNDSISLPQGVRYIYSIDGSKCLSRLEEFVHSMSYVCSSADRFKGDASLYTNAFQPMWAFVSSRQLVLPPARSIRATFEKEPNEFVRPRIVTVIRNGLKPRRVVRHLLNKRTAQSFEYVMQDITSAVRLNSGTVRKLYGLSGKQVNCLADFFADDHIFVAFGPEKVTCDDFDIITEEYRRMNLWSGRHVPRRQQAAGGMPPRNEGFQKMLSPDPKSNLDEAMRLPRVLAGRVEILSLLGDGNTALVFKARFRDAESGEETIEALKIISQESTKEMREFIEAEIDILSSIKHENVVALRESLLIDGAWYMRMEILEDGDLFEYLKRERRTLSERDAASCTQCLCHALNFLHNRGIIHRDVKPENLLVFKQSPLGPLMLKLGDFGLACRMEENELLYHLCGTPTYVAPEVLAEFGYSFSADCWSVGIILYILLAGFPPFGVEEDRVLFNKILRGVFEFPSPPFVDTSYAARYLIRALLTTEPRSRLTAGQVLEEQWIQNGGFADPMEEERCMLRLEELMHSLMGSREDGDLDESEHFLSRKASMDQFSDCNPGEGEHAKTGECYSAGGVNEEARGVDEEISRNISRASFEFVPSSRLPPK